MDIGNLLDAVDDGLDESFEKFDAIEAETNLDRTATVVSTLQQAAAIVAEEDRAEARKVFGETAEEILDVVQEKNKDETHEDILFNAAEEVDNEYNDDHFDDGKKEDNVVVDDDDDDSDIDRDDGEDDDDDDQDPELNQELFVCCYRENVSQLKKLLRSGANPFARDRHGWTPLHWAASRGFNEVIEILLDARQDSGKSMPRYINSKEFVSGWTPLHAACINTHTQSVELLLRHKARRKALDKFGEKPVDCIGKSKQSKNVRRLLLERKK